MKKLRYVLALVISLTGCASSPKIPSFTMKQGDKVGVLVEIGQHPIHTHIGTTIFNNFEKSYPYQWGLDLAITDILTSALSQAGFEVVDLEKDGVRYSAITPLVVNDRGAWRLSPGKDKVYRALLKEKGLKAIVVVKETRVMSALECAGGPCTPRYTEASGLYTRSFLGIDHYIAVAAFDLDVCVLDPLANLAEADPLRSMMSQPVVPLKDFADPKDFKQLTEADLRPVRDAILKFSEQMSREITKQLKPG